MNFKKMGVIVLAMAMVFTTIGAYTFNKVSAEDDSDTPDTIKMPITIYDHLNDGLLFEYPLDGDGKGLAMYNDTKTDENTGQTYQEKFWKEVEGGLISSALDKNTGTPVYKEETVKNVAEIVKKLMDSGYDGSNGGKVNNALYKQLYKQITKYEFGEKVGLAEKKSVLPTQEEITSQIKPATERYKTYKEMGWTLKDAQQNEIEDPDDIQSSNGNSNSVWVLDGDYLKSNELGATAEFDFGELEQGNYKLKYWSLEKMDAFLVSDDDILIKELECGTNKYWGDEWIKFSLSSDTRLKLKLKVTGSGAVFCNGRLAKDNEDSTVLKDNFGQKSEKVIVPAQVPTLGEYDIQSSENSKWRVQENGYGFTSGETYEPTAGYIYKDLDVEENKTYNLTYNNERCKVVIKADDGTVLSQAGSGINVQSFTIPNGVNRIRIEISQDDTDNTEKGYRMIKAMDIEKQPTLPKADLGNYDDSVNEFSDKSKGLSDVTTCMDYAYYVLNNFWSNTNNQITQKTNNYTSLTLKKDADGYYKIDQNNLVYDLENKTIYKSDEATGTNGYFPLDNSTLGDKNDLSSPFGRADGEIEFNGSHNYHFATKAHTQFIYKPGLVFSFSGDDDVYLFIDGRKVLFKDNAKNTVDLGGAHASIFGKVEIDDYAENFGLVEGQVYDMDFFHLERHSWASNFSITTNISFKEPKIKANTDFLDANGNSIANETKLELGTEVGIKYELTAENVGNNEDRKMSNLSFDDSGLGVKISADGIKIPKDIYIKDKLVFKVLDPKGNIVGESFEILKDEINDETIKDIISKLEVGKNNTVVVEGLYTKVTTQLLTSKLDGGLDVKVDRYNDESMSIMPSDFTAKSEDTVKVVPQNTPKAELTVELTDKLGNQLISSNLNVGDNVYVNYTLTSKSPLMKGISLDDKGTGITISKDGITVPEKYDIDDEVKIVLTRKDGTTEEVVLSKEDVENGKDISVFNFDSEDAWILNDGDSIKIIGIYTTLNENNLKVHSDVVAKLNGPEPSYDSETGKLDINYISPDLNGEASIAIVIKDNGSEEPTKPVDPTEPTTPEEPTKPVEPTEPTAPVEPTTPTDEAKVDLVLFKVNQDEQFLEGASFRVVKVVDGKEVLVGEQKDGPLFVFKQLDDGVYRVYETKSPTDYDGLDTYFEIEIKDGQIYFDEEVNQSFTIYNTNDGTDPFVLGDEIELNEYYEWLENQNGGKEQISVEEQTNTEKVEETVESNTEDTKKVKTSDDENIVLYASLCGLAVTMTSIIVLRKKREELINK